LGLKCLRWGKKEGKGGERHRRKNEKKPIKASNGVGQKG